MGASAHLDAERARQAGLADSIAETAVLEESAQPMSLVDRILAAGDDTDACSEIHEELCTTYGRDCGNAMWCEAVREAEAIEAAASDRAARDLAVLLAATGADRATVIRAMKSLGGTA
jgi:hypothetical protein